MYPGAGGAWPRPDPETKASELSALLIKKQPYLILASAIGSSPQEARTIPS